MRRALPVVVIAITSVLALAAGAGARVLRVGTYRGIPGQYRTLQAAIRAARPGDWILIAPGDYKTSPSQITTPKGQPNFPAGVVITKPRLHIIGLNRNTVIIDGTRPGSAACSRRASAQNYGLAGHGGVQYGVRATAASAKQRSGENGLMVYKARDVTIENLTVCNFLGGAAEAGNEVWWNGGADSGKVGGYDYYGAYLSTTSTYLKGKSKAGEFSGAQYGVFSSNWSGGTWDHIYASNFNDSGFYIGACQDVCDQTVDHAHAQYNALGYSGTNSGGRLLVENSEFDHNEDGFDTNSQNADEPAPQNGACPPGVSPPIAGAPTCWVFFHNDVHDNNNPNVPAAGSAAAGPVGTGMSISGGRNDTVMDNTFAHNDAWGTIFVPYLDSGQPCISGTLNAVGQGSCLWDDYGDHLLGNTYVDNGSYGHPSNGDFAQVNFLADPLADCFSGNSGAAGGPLTSDSAAAQAAHPTCAGQASAGGSTNSHFLDEVLCDSQVELSPGTPASCPSGPYPRVTKIVMHKLARQPTMPHPCADVPRNPWCGSTKHKH